MVNQADWVKSGVRIPKEMYAEIVAEAREAECSINARIIALLRAGIDARTPLPEYRICPVCEGQYQVNPSERGKPRRFCSDACKAKDYRKNKSGMDKKTIDKLFAPIWNPVEKAYLETASHEIRLHGEEWI